MVKRGLNEANAAETLWTDYRRTNRPDVPGFLKKYGFGERGDDAPNPPTPQASILPRQKRHLK